MLAQEQRLGDNPMLTTSGDFHESATRIVDQTNDLPSSTKTTTHNPTERFQRLVHDEKDDAAQLADLANAVKEMWTELGMTAIQKIYDSVSNESVRESLMGAVLHEATQTGFQIPFSAAVELTGGARSWTLHEIVSQWARIDPRTTFDAVWNLASTDPASRLLQTRAAWEWAETNPKEALANLELVPDNIRIFAQEKALLALVKLEPESAIEHLQTFAGSRTESTLAHEIAKNLIPRNPHSALKWIHSHEFSHPTLKIDVLETAFRAYARHEPEVAFRTALQEPRERGRGGLESVVIGEVAKSDTSQAIAMLANVRDEGHTIFDSYKSIALEMVVTHLEFDEVLELGRELPHWHEEFYRDLFIQWGAHHPVELLKRIEKIPQEHQSFAAYSLLANNTGSLVLNSKQVKVAQNYLNDGHGESVANLPTYAVSRVQFSTSDQAEFTPDELAELAAKENTARNQIKLRKEGD